MMSTIETRCLASETHDRFGSWLGFASRISRFSCFSFFVRSLFLRPLLATPSFFSLGNHDRDALVVVVADAVDRPTDLCSMLAPCIDYIVLGLSRSFSR